MVELMRVGGTKALACGEHHGTMPLPEPNSTRIASLTLQHKPSGTYAGGGSYGYGAAKVKISPADNGTSTRIEIYAGSSSTGAHATLRLGTCSHRVPGPQIILEPLVSDYASKTLVEMPYRVFEAEHRTVNISADGFSFDARTWVCLQT